MIITEGVKKKMWVYFGLILYLSDFVSGQPVNTTLKLELVQVLFRHGTRTPFEAEAELLSHSNESLYDPWGLGQLTKDGMIQEYEIGKMLRERYNDFLPNLYKPAHVYAYSSGTARTKASLELVLAALYPPSKELQWNNNLNWIPIPIHSNPFYLDILMQSRDCPVYLEQYQKQRESNEVVQALLSYGQMSKKLKEIYGKSIELRQIFQLYNVIKIHKNLKLPLPNWHTDELFKDTKRVSEFYLDVLSSTNTLKRLNGGPFVKRFLDNINNLNQQKYKRKIYLYSAHDKNVHAYLKSHNITEQKQPDYGATIILETHSDSDNKLYVKLLYWNGEPKQLKTLKLEGCSEICPLEMYSEIVKPVLPSDDDMLCLIKNATPKDFERQFYDTDQIQ